MTDVYTKSKRSEIMSCVKNKGTQAENAVAAMLDELGVSYERNDKTLPGHPDFVVRSAKAVLFVNGCFWHGHTNCGRARLPDSNIEFWTAKIRKNKARDGRNARLLRKDGWAVITVWQCGLRKRERLKQRLKKLLTIQTIKT